MARAYAHRCNRYGRPLVGDGSVLGHSPTEVDTELEELNGEIEAFSQEVGTQYHQTVGPVQAEADAALHDARAAEHAAFEQMRAWEPLASKTDGLRQAIEDAKSDGEVANLQVQLAGAQAALDAAVPKAVRDEQRRIAQDLHNKRAQLETAFMDAHLHGNPIVQWVLGTAAPFFEAWRTFYHQKKDIPAQTWPLSGTWDHIQDFRQRFIDLRNGAPFRSTSPAPIAPRKDPSITGGIGDVWTMVKVGIYGVLGLGALVAVASIANSVRTKQDPVDKLSSLVDRYRARGAARLAGARR